jgi:hypothetical protein
VKIIFSILSFSIVSLCLVQNAWAQKPLPSPVFYQTRSSDEWVSHSIHVQKAYSRVLVVDASEHPPQRIRVSALNLNARETDQTATAREYNVQAVFRTLQEAADVAKGGDLIAVMPGTYTGFVLEDKPSAGDGQYIHFKAMGQPGDVVINQYHPIAIG